MKYRCYDVLFFPDYDKAIDNIVCLKTIEEKTIENIKTRFMRHIAFSIVEEVYNLD